jgi:hypothetical protein
MFQTVLILILYTPFYVAVQVVHLNAESANRVFKPAHSYIAA